MKESPGFAYRGACPACIADKQFILDLVEDKILQQLIKHNLVLPPVITAFENGCKSSHSHVGWGDFNYTIYHTDVAIKTLGPFRIGHLTLQFKFENGNIGFRYFMSSRNLKPTVANIFVVSLSHPKSIQKIHTWMEKVFKLFCNPALTNALCRVDFNKAIKSYTSRLGHGDWVNL